MFIYLYIFKLHHHLDRPTFLGLDGRPISRSFGKYCKRRGEEETAGCVVIVLWK